MELLTKLKNVGLSDKEASVYLAMLELGPSPVLEISAKSGVNRPTTYLQIEALKKKGLVSTQKKGKKDLFIAESPDQLENLIAREKQSVEARMELLKQSLPQFMQLFETAGDRPYVRYFEGKEGLLRMQEEFLRCKGKLIYSISNKDNVTDLFPNHRSDYTERRAKLGITARSIYTTRRGRLEGDDKNILRETHYIPYDKLPFDADITVFDNMVAIASLKGKVGGLMIEQENIADSFKSVFELIWKLSENVSA